MLNKLRERMDDQYFDGLVRAASKRSLGLLLSSDDEGKRRFILGCSDFDLIDAIHVFCKLSRKIAEKRLDEGELIDCLEDWATLLVSINDFLGSGEHTLRADVISHFERATRSVWSRCSALSVEDPALAGRLEEHLNTPFRPAGSWGEFAQQTAGVKTKHFPNFPTKLRFLLKEDDARQQAAWLENERRRLGLRRF